MVSRNLNQLKFFFLDTKATCLRLETFDQAEVKISPKKDHGTNLRRMTQM